MGIEGDGDGARAGLMRFANHGGEDFSMTAMDTVKVADGSDRGTKACGNLRSRAKDWNTGDLGQQAERVLGHRFTGARETGRVRPS